MEGQGSRALRNRQGAGLAGGQSFLPDILLTSLRHVNWPEAGFARRRIQIGVLGRFLSSAHALGLTVSHKTVAEVI
jgi:hypothetical protein